MANYPECVSELLQELIRIPSVNPDDSPGTQETGEEKLAQYLRGYLEEMGYSVSLEWVRPGRPNLIARCPQAPHVQLGETDRRPRVLFGPHLDTVGVAGMSVAPFAAEQREGKIYGRGACDTKGPMAAMLQALRNSREILSRLPVAVDFVGFMGEESSQWGSKHFAQQYKETYQFALIGEPTSLDIVYVTKGSLWATLEASGKAAHSSQPELGENAICKLARVIDLIDRELTPELARFTHPVLGGSTQNMGVISGGTRANIVPDAARIQIDIRTTPSLYQAGGALHFLETFIKAHQLPVSIKNAHENPPMEMVVDHPWIQQLQKIPKDETSGKYPEAVGAPWFSDAAHLSDAGIPSVCIGPGSIDQAHTKDEFIEIDQLEMGERYFTQWIDSLRGYQQKE